MKILTVLAVLCYLTVLSFIGAFCMFLISGERNISSWWAFWFALIVHIFLYAFRRPTFFWKLWEEKSRKPGNRISIP